ncbi:MAG: adenosylcobinamide-GDP ribazoletransferase [Rhodobacteraceae bacterium]|nr:adenosylcobinamide-GDP ribazoletransferase [Paracoccaceae bacterium]
MKVKFHDILAAFTLLSRLPVPVDHERAGKRGAAAAWAYPLVGAALGAIAGLLGWGLVAAGMTAGMAAFFVIMLQIALSGALHEDGLADMADGMGGFTPARRLEIMKDSRIGVYGTLALILVILGRHTGISVQIGPELPLILAALGAGSRAMMVSVMAGLKNARPDGMSAAAGRPSLAAALLAQVLALLISLIAFGWYGILVLLVMGLAAFIIAFIAKTTLGGQTGDVLGASQQSSEIIGLAVI